ncbi:MAG: DUF559 domain-containing protein, partial [Candidatus Schekmanbacteria bacterium]|nr:DUF559 domain-containing protein [Candidatus Schekmanbacteria bacterium]
HPIGQFIVDFVCLEKKLIIEVDGSQHSEHADARRSQWLQKEGYQIIRFWNNQVLQQKEAVGDIIWTALNKPDNHPHPDPPPSRGREQEKTT